MIDIGLNFPIPTLDHDKFLNFVAVLMEQTWWFKNLIKFEQQITSWDELSAKINKTTEDYWNANIRRKIKRSFNLSLSIWKPPKKDWIKFNFDAAFSDGVATLAYIARDYISTSCGAWMKMECVHDVFSAEAAMVYIAMRKAKDSGILFAILKVIALVLNNVSKVTQFLWNGLGKLGLMKVFLGSIRIQSGRFILFLEMLIPIAHNLVQ